jgi:hypothetical protein
MRELDILEKSDVVPRYGFDEVLGRRHLTQSNLEMIGIVESVQEVSVEGMDIVKHRKALLDASELLAKSLLSKLDLPSIETCRKLIRSRLS